MIPYTDLCEQNGGRKNLIGRRFRVFRWMWNYFDLKLVKTTDLPPSRPYVFGVHPHGILPFGCMVALGYEHPNGFSALFPGINFRVLAATFAFYIPIYRDILLWGGVVDAARYSAHKILEAGMSLALVPGGGACRVAVAACCVALRGTTSCAGHSHGGAICGSGAGHGLPAQATRVRAPRSGARCQSCAGLFLCTLPPCLCRPEHPGAGD